MPIRSVAASSVAIAVALASEASAGVLYSNNFDGQALGQIGSSFAMEIAITKARTVGVATVALRDTGHIGAAGCYALQAARAPFRNPLGQFLLAATNWMVIPLRRIVPSAFGYDSSSLLLAWLWQMIYVAIAGMLGAAFESQGLQGAKVIGSW